MTEEQYFADHADFESERQRLAMLGTLFDRCCQSNANQSPIVPEHGLFMPPVRATRPGRLSGSV